MSDNIFDEIPSVDLAHFVSGTPGQKETFVNDLVEAYSNIGFVSIKNHGLSSELSGQLYDVIKKFFSLSGNIKSSYKDITTGEFLKERLLESGLKKELS